MGVFAIFLSVCFRPEIYLQKQLPATTKIEFKKDRFWLSGENSIEEVPVVGTALSSTQVGKASFRKDDFFAVWDHRGLSLRKGKTLVVTRLEDLPLSKAIFREEEIRENQILANLGVRQLAASSLAGSLRLGATAFFLLRYSDQGGTPWTNILVKVDLAASKPGYTAVNRFDGETIGRANGENHLFFRNDRPSAFARKKDKWGLVEFDILKKSAFFKSIGDGQVRFDAGPKGFLRFYERPRVDVTVLGIVDIDKLVRTPLLETSGTANFIDGAKPWLAIVAEERTVWLANLENGARTKIGEDTAIRRARQGVLTWQPTSNPNKAVLLDQERWEVISTWQAPIKTPEKVKDAVKKPGQNPTTKSKPKSKSVDPKTRSRKPSKPPERLANRHRD